jgi:hypothetical protein
MPQAVNAPKTNTNNSVNNSLNYDATNKYFEDAIANSKDPE